MGFDFKCWEGEWHSALCYFLGYQSSFSWHITLYDSNLRKCDLLKIISYCCCQVLISLGSQIPSFYNNFLHLYITYLYTPNEFSSVNENHLEKNPCCWLLPTTRWFSLLQFILGVKITCKIDSRVVASPMTISTRRKPFWCVEWKYS